MRLQNLNLRFGTLELYRNFNLTLDFEFTAILGPSGCGKSTLLAILAGLVQPNHGTVETFHRPAFLFQEPRLFPWLTLAQNWQAALPSRTSGSWRSLADRAGLEPYLDFYPHQLSGGLARRAALVRALAYPGDGLLLDEPTDSLDGVTRDSILDLLVDELGQNPRPVVCVTHDTAVVDRLADRVVVLGGRPAVLLDDRRGLQVLQKVR